MFQYSFSVSASRLLAATTLLATDGMPSVATKNCWHTLGHPKVGLGGRKFAPFRQVSKGVQRRGGPGAQLLLRGRGHELPGIPMVHIDIANGREDVCGIHLQEGDRGPGASLNYFSFGW